MAGQGVAVETRIDRSHHRPRMLMVALLTVSTYEQSVGYVARHLLDEAVSWM